MTLEDLLRKNEVLRDLHAGKRCFIVGNGPSLKKHDLTKLSSEVTIVSSSFFRHPDSRAIHPNYWILADPNFWNRPEKFFSPIFETTCEKNVDVKLFVPTTGAQFFTNINTGPLIDLHFFHYDQAKNIQSRIDFTSGVPPYGQNVIVVSLMLAFYLGCSPIYFIGCDHDFMNVKHEEYDAMKVEHFYLNLNQNKASEHLTWNQWQEAMARMNYEYNQLKQYADLHGFAVYNATPGGSFNTFPRIDFDSLFPYSFNLLAIGVAPANRNKRDALHLGKIAINLMNAGDNESADTLLDEAIRSSINTPYRMDGLRFVKALCLAKLGKYEDALIQARCDFATNPANRTKCEPLLRQLENLCGFRSERFF